MPKDQTAEQPSGLRLGLRIDADLAQRLRAARELAPLASRSALLRQLLSIGLARVANNPEELNPRPRLLAEGC